MWWKEQKWGRRGLKEKKKEPRQSYVWSWPCLQATACVIQSQETMELLSERCLSNNQKGERGRGSSSPLPPDHWAKVLPVDIYVARVWQPSMLPRGPTDNITQRPEGRKQGHRVDLRWVMVICTWGSWLPPHRTGHSRNKGQVRSKPLKWFTSGVPYTHIGGEGQFPPFTTLSVFLGFSWRYVCITESHWQYFHDI